MRLVKPVTLFLALSLAAASAAADKPSVIRIAYSGAGTGGRPLGSGNVLSIANQVGAFEKEFKPDGIKIEWNFYPGAGPATNEALANGLIDFAYHGDLPLIVGRSTGLKQKIVAALGRFGNTYFVVPSESNAQSLADLKGKRLAVNKGTAGQLTLNRVLARYGFKEKDFKIISMNTDNTKAALATGDIDGAIISSPFDLKARGIARILFEIPRDPQVTGVGTFWVSSDFEGKYPDITQRVVTALVRTAQYASEEKNRDQVFKYWASAGTITYGDFLKTWEGYTLRERNSPLLDEYYVASIRKAIGEAQAFKLVRRPVSLDGWIEPKYLKKALQDLSLETYWDEDDAEGRPKASVTKVGLNGDR